MLFKKNPQFLPNHQTQTSVSEILNVGSADDTLFSRLAADPTFSISDADV